MAMNLQAGSIVVHYGMPKTGSSSIQASLYRNLADERFHYVMAGGLNANKALVTAFRKNPEAHEHHRRLGTTADQIPDLRNQAQELLGNEFGRARNKIAIFSSELVYNMGMDTLQAMHEFIREYSVPKAVGYIRSPKGFMESALQQRVQAGHYELQDIVRPPSYRKKIGRLETVFGADNVVCWAFDPKSFSGGCVTQDFCHRLGIDFRPEDVVRKNEALPLPALRLLYAYRKYGPGYGVGPDVTRENTSLIRRISSLTGPKLRFHSSLIAPIIEQHREDIAWMEERLGASLAEDLEKDDEQAIRSEQDLLRFSPESLQWLAEQLGPAYVKRWHPDMEPAEVAAWMHALRLKLADKLGSGGLLASEALTLPQLRKNKQEIKRS